MRIVFILFILSLSISNAFSSRSETRKRRISESGNTSTVEKKNSTKKVDQKKADKVNINRLSLQAKRMLHEGEAFRSHQNISGLANFHSVTCPVCETRFKTFYIQRQLPEKGMDADFCKHSKNPSAYDFNVWCCPTCGYSNFAHLFTLKPKAYDDETFRGNIEKTLRQLFIINLGTDIKKLGYKLDQSDIPTYMKYYLLSKIIQDEEFSHKLKSDFHLHYSWVHRIRFLAPVADPNLSLAISVFNDKLHKYAKRNHISNILSYPDKTLTFLEGMDIDTTDTIETSLSLLFQAKCHDRLGQPRLAMQFLKHAISSTINPKLRKILISKKRILLDEFEQTKLALKYLRLALQDNAYSKKEAPQFIYLVGQLSKRLGLKARAHLWLKSSLDILEKTSPSIFKLAKKELNAIGPFDTASDLEMEKILLFTSLAYLNDKIKHKNNPKFKLADINYWLTGIENACSRYYSELDFDPKGVNELIDVGLLKSFPKLETDAKEYFKIKIFPKQASSQKRYEIITTIPYEDEKGLFWPTIYKGKISRLRQ